MTYEILAAVTQSAPSTADYARYNFYAALVTAVILVIYTAVTAWQAMLTRAALAQTRRSNDHAEQSNEIAHRAWIVVSLKANDIDVAAPHITPVLELTNLGAVPATDVEVWGRFDLYDNPPGIEDEITPRSGQDSRAGIVVANGKPYELIVHDWDELSSTEIKKPEPDEKPRKVYAMGTPSNSERAIERIAKREAIYVFYCEVTYRDIFDKPRKTVACLQMAPRLNWQDRFDYWVYAPKHNRLT